MSHACCGEPEAAPASRVDVAAAAADGLAFAAMPVFALLALWTAFAGDRSGMLCIEMRDASPLNGMALMYGLMSAFHATPWLKAISRSWSGRRALARR